MLPEEELKVEWLMDSQINVSQHEWLKDNQHNEEELLHYIQEQEQHIREEQATIRDRKLRLAEEELKQRRELQQEMGWLEYNQQTEEEMQKLIQELRLHEEGQQEQELSSGLVVDRLAEAELAEQDELEENSLEQKIGANLKKKTEAEKEETEKAGEMVSNNKAGDMAINFFKTKDEAELKTKAASKTEAENKKEPIFDFLETKEWKLRLHK